MFTLLAFFVVLAASAPAPSSTEAAPPAYATDAPISLDLNRPAYVGPANAGLDTGPQPIRGGLGADIIGQNNVGLAMQNADTLAPPTTDEGNVGNPKWPFSLSHNRLQTGGWARQQNTQVFPIGEKMASVDMRLEKGAIREMHWHTTAEWAYVLSGTTQVSAVDTEGRNYRANVNAGDLWYFPPGVPHSLQGLSDEGTEFLLVFPDGAFDEDGTLLLTDWLSHTPVEALSKNFGLPPEAFARVPSQELYIFPSEEPSTDTPVEDPYGQTPIPFTYAFSQVNATTAPGGTFKIADSTVFPVATKIAVGEVTVQPGTMRELHWHPTADEWGYILSGQARITLFAGSSTASTFDFQAGDISYIPASYGHYVENIGNETLKYLEVFNTDRYSDISLRQWLGTAPPGLVKAHLGWNETTIAQLGKTKPVVVAPYTP
ncbi:oxalate decarboxylase [Peniophora sp. CONT]|nr:oxalate decarboxylase [Peniophora sp. CONT]